MKQIRKNKEPKSLTEHRKKEHADYENYSEKKELRESLHTEQRAICCYCMAPIVPKIGEMKIEHFECQENFPDKQLIYRNMLGACMGNEGQPGDLQHCDTYKGTKPLSFYPPNQKFAIENLILYSNDGSIYSNNKKLDKELNEVLNLNVTKLKNNRKAALDGFKISLEKYKKEIKKPTLERWFNDWVGISHANNLRPYCMVVAFWIAKRLERYK